VDEVRPYRGIFEKLIMILTLLHSPKDFGLKRHLFKSQISVFDTPGPGLASKESARISDCSVT
jgi:hypothetical protein